MSRESESHGSKCAHEWCYCLVEQDEKFCSERCRKASKSERPTYECKCDHEDCEESDDDE